MKEDANGGWVSFDDYSKLKEETIKQLETAVPPIEAYIAKLEEENKRLRMLDSLKTVSLTDSPTWKAIGDYAEAKDENARLKAEVERLSKAGDAMAEQLELEYLISQPARRWRAAKEGKDER